MRTTPDIITKLEHDEIFVFGSNLAGRHGAGAAKQARYWGAKYGKAEGLSGHTYAIPTKDQVLNTLPLHTIEDFVEHFLWCSKNLYPQLTFLVTPIGCGLAGYNPKQIGPMFKGSPDNVILPASFL